MDVNSLQSGANIAYLNGNAAIDTRQLQQDAEDEQQVAKSVTNLAEVKNEEEQAKVNADTADTNSQAVEDALSSVTDFVQSKNQALSFSFDEDSNRSIIKVTDAKSGDVIRQIPTEEVVKLSERIKELQSDVGETIGLGVLLNNQV
ncbi:flagellar protein FlaG [Algibacillus agarilyticus]|uniref:flagellar protein FlaG n=1 Tax=Algibacillus agarilyticus TaxID=2234133 RepID=UPI000DD064A8|nr:flagellar protein FlaG [Algibacillus agarilyticus]